MNSSLKSMVLMLALGAASAGSSAHASTGSEAFIVNVGNAKCLDAQASSGRKLMSSRCHGEANQAFVISGDQIRVGGLCLDVWGGSNQHLAPVTAYGCHGGANQKWKLESNGTIRSLLPGKPRCLDVAHEDGDRISLWACTPGSPDQLFKVESGQDSYIVNKGLFKCLDVEGGIGSGRELMTYDCHGEANQTFVLLGDQIRVGGLCLDVWGGSNKKLAPVATNVCHGGANQKWKLQSDGTIRSLLPGKSRCLDVAHESGQRISLWDCTPSSPDQQFSVQHDGFWSPFTLAITSDPQYPWKNEGDIRSSGSEVGDSQISIPLTYRSINEYHDTVSPLAGVIVNGDVTAFGHGWQWDYMHSELAKLKAPVLMGLGNHDYQNNVNDCAQNGCVRNSLNAFEKYLPADARVDRAVKYYYEFPTNYKEFSGSYAWSKDIEGVHFVFLNNEPTYSFQAQGYNAAHARRERFRIESAIPWLDRDLTLARAKGQPIVLIYHKPSEFAQTNSFTRLRFEEMVRKYKVSLTFWGHVHTAGEAAQRGTFGGAPALFSGSASTQTYLFAKFDRTLGHVDVYWSKKGNIENMPRVARVPLKTPIEKLAPDSTSLRTGLVNE